MAEPSRQEVTREVVERLGVAVREYRRLEAVVTAVTLVVILTGLGLLIAACAFGRWAALAGGVVLVSSGARLAGPLSGLRAERAAMQNASRRLPIAGPDESARLAARLVERIIDRMRAA